jgi:hypothetical protein
MQYVVSITIETGSEWTEDQIREMLEVAVGTTEDVNSVSVRDVISED